MLLAELLQHVTHLRQSHTFYQQLCSLAFANIGGHGRGLIRAHTLDYVMLPLDGFAANEPGTFMVSKKAFTLHVKCSR